MPAMTEVPPSRTISLVRAWRVDSGVPAPPSMRRPVAGSFFCTAMSMITVPASVICGVTDRRSVAST